jgi:TetR/AcrR family transcriptional regulator, regulator of cefoperazone and chloramphenicol sensitivity
MYQELEAQTTSERLLEAAGQIFAEKGFEAATVREICDRAQANIAAVNFHFGGKERLYIETVKHAHRCKASEMPMPDWPPGTPPAQKLRDFIRAILGRMIVDPSPAWHAKLIMRELVEPTAACAEMVRHNIQPMCERLMAILDELLPADMPMRERYLIGFSIVGQCFHYRVNKPVVALLVGEEEYREYTVDLLAKHIADFTLAALGHGPPVTKTTGA